MALSWLRLYPIGPVLQTIWRTHERTVMKCINRVIFAGGEIMKRKLDSWPSESETKEIMRIWNPKLIPHGLNNCIFVIDGTEWKVCKPKDSKRRKLFSAKKKQYSYNIIVVVTLEGKIRYVSDPLPHTSNDQGLWNELQLRARFFQKTYGIMGDGIFTFNPEKRSYSIIGVSPFKNSAKQKLDISEKKYNTALARFRVVVENVNAHGKKFRILGEKLRHQHVDENAQRMKYISAWVWAIVKEKIDLNPLRKASWLPSEDSGSDYDSE